MLQDGASSGPRSPSIRRASPSRARSSSATWSSSRASSGRHSRASPGARPGPMPRRPCGRCGASPPRSSGGRESLHRLVYDRKLGTALADAGETLRQLGETVRRIDRVLADPRTADLAGEAGRTLAEARARRGAGEPDPARGRGGQGDAPRAHLRRGAHAEGSRGHAGAGGDAGGRRRAWRGRARRAAQRSGYRPGVRRVVTAADGLAQAVDRARTRTASCGPCSWRIPPWRGISGTPRGASARSPGGIARGEGDARRAHPARGAKSIKQVDAGAGANRQAGRGARRGREARRGPGGPAPGDGGLPRRSRAGSRPARARSAGSSRTRPSTRTSPRSWRARSGACSCAPSSAPRSAAGRPPRAPRRLPERRRPAAVRPVSVYRCQACGFQAGKWYGRCPDCGEFNTIVEERTARAHRGAGGFGRRAPSARGAGAGGPCPWPPCRSEGAARIHSGMAELDRVLGGGVVPGSLVLIGGDPGIGKSTLLLQASAALARDGGAGPLRVGRGVGRAGEAPRGAPRAGGVGAPHPGRDTARDHRGPRGGDRAAGGGRRLDPDRVSRRTSSRRRAA